MSFIINQNYGPVNMGSVGNQMNVSATQQNEYASQTPKQESNEEKVKDDASADDENVVQLTNRQLIILMTTLMDLSLDPEYLNQRSFSRLLSNISGKKLGGIRQSVMDARKNGFETKEARQDMLTVASMLEDLAPNLAQKLKNDAKD